MNILFFLTPKEAVAYVYDDYPLGQVMQRMEQLRYAAIPVLRRSGEYFGTLTEGDVLWAIKNKYCPDIDKASNLPISDIPRRSDNKAVTVSTNIDDLISMALDQNFVPVEDDRGMFIGIVTRRHVIQYYKDKLESMQKEYQAQREMPLNKDNSEQKGNH